MPYKQTTFKVSYNEFANDNNQIGFFNNDPEPYEFLSIEDLVEERVLDETGSILKTTISLSDIQYSYERKSYTALMLIGDIGGFNGAILLFLHFLMRFYS